MKFVKRQAAIKNEPGFVEERFQRSDLIAKVSGVHTDRQTSNYVTDMTALGVTEHKLQVYEGLLVMVFLIIMKK